MVGRSSISSACESSPQLDFTTTQSAYEPLLVYKIHLPGDTRAGGEFIDRFALGFTGVIHRSPPGKA